jgi:hypothetical protein
MAFFDTAPNICRPALIYLIVSFIGFFVLVTTSFGNTNNLCLGAFKCDQSNLYMVYLINIMYILLWTWLLNLLCKYGGELIAWIFVLLPISLLLLIVGWETVDLLFTYISAMFASATNTLFYYVPAVVVLIVLFFTLLIFNK